jgi:hypothetical protein
MYCIEVTAATSWCVVDSCSQPLGPNHGLCCLCRNWRLFFMVMLTSTQQTKRMIVICLLNTSAHNLLYGGGSQLETLLPGDVNFRSTNKVEVLIIACSVSDAGVAQYVSVSCRNWHNLLYGGASKLEILLCGDVNFRSTNEVQLLIVISFLNVSTHELLYRGGCSISSMCWCQCHNWRRFSIVAI